MAKIVMALDQGTSSSRTVLFDENANILASASQPFDSTFPQSGWVEQDPEEIWLSQKATIEKALVKAGLKMKSISAIGITNQRETIIAWNRETGNPIGRAIVWQCRRTADFCKELIREGFDKIIRNKTGLVTDSYFSGTKMHWILKHRDEAKQLANEGKLLFGTVDSWLIWKLTGGKSHVTDVSNASRTLVYNIFENRWDQEILNRLKIPLETLPEVKGSSEIVGYTDSSDWGTEIPICGVAGDQQAALFGQACFEKGMAKNTYGTGCFLLMNTGSTPRLSEHGLLTTIAWKIGSEVTYAQEGSVFMGGALIQWLRDKLELFKDAAVTEAMATSVDDTGGLYIVPAFVGLGAPHWDSYARGLMIGITRDTGKNHIVRAALEAIAYQSYDLLKCMEKDTNVSLSALKVDGGATTNDFLCQFQADILQLDVSRPRIIETTALGAAFLAGLAVGIWRDQDHITSLWQEDKRFTPRLEEKRINGLLKGWQSALDRSKNWLS
ncbi:glycerol kinase GlpK [bacterium]|nr:glycerol kinase GlpK [bacterium]